MSKCSNVGFINGPAVYTLPKCYQGAINRSKTGTQTISDDNLIGSACSPNQGAICDGKPVMPMCSQSQYAKTQYCACVNAGTPWSECIFPQCSEGIGYKTTQQRDNINAKQCPSNVSICQSITKIIGDKNVSDVVQHFNCNATVNTNIPPQLQTIIKLSKKIISIEPKYIILILIVIVLLVLVLLFPPPPEFSPTA